MLYPGRLCLPYLSGKVSPGPPFSAPLEPCPSTVRWVSSFGMRSRMRLPGLHDPGNRFSLVASIAPTTSTRRRFTTLFGPVGEWDEVFITPIILFYEGSFLWLEVWYAVADQNPFLIRPYWTVGYLYYYRRVSPYPSCLSKGAAWFAASRGLLLFFFSIVSSLS